MELKDFCFDGSRKLILADMPTAAGAEDKAHKAELVHRTGENLNYAAELQEKLYAAGQEGLVVAIQARDAAGKDSLIKKVFSRLNPRATAWPPAASRMTSSSGAMCSCGTGRNTCGRTATAW